VIRSVRHPLDSRQNPNGQPERTTTTLLTRSRGRRTLDGERIMPLRAVRGDARGCWQLQHSRVLTLAQLCQQHDLPVGELQRIMMGVGPIVVDLPEPSHLVPGLAPGAE
jgi:hypothetical protein